MHHIGSKIAIFAAVALLLSGHPIGAADEQVTGTIIGKVGELLEINLPMAVQEGAVFEVRSILNYPPIAEARVMSCTEEWPYIALAKVAYADYQTVIPIGAKVFAVPEKVTARPVVFVAEPPMFTIPQPKNKPSNRLSIQAGAFYPRPPVMRDTVADFWQEYRLNYSFLKLRDFDATLTTGYIYGSGDFATSTGGSLTRSVEVIPVALIGRYTPLRVRGISLFLGAGAGAYRISNEEELDGNFTRETDYEFGHEFTAGLESTSGWTLELRYRDVPDTNIQGFSLALGARF